MQILAIWIPVHPELNYFNKLTDYINIYETVSQIQQILLHGTG